ncbi:zinc metallopeptidase [Pyrenophora seminiperda CCB06]|uniref:Zinc metallopeptidase n=1 Tax=Pyrenophora seminiperda CCB06 TaxID=1302712 RepID=A0A3M7LWY8_9PLEO|nr:zinc metallopeptidase [Pyrenophora seminiperda CCB06]
MQEIDAHFDGYEHLKHLPRDGDALHMLRKAASMVKPMMRKRGWKVGTLAEFLPDEPQLLGQGLNINRTERILIRLRYHYDSRQFLSMEQITDTLLHELSHIVFGPHNADFNNLWNELRDEHQSLLSKGYTGEGFLSQGQKLGGKRIPLDEMRRQARIAAEKRKITTNANAGGHRLGGTRPGGRDIDMRKVIADAANPPSRTASPAQNSSGLAWSKDRDVAVTSSIPQPYPTRSTAHPPQGRPLSRLVAPSSSRTPPSSLPKSTRAPSRLVSDEEEQLRRKQLPPTPPRTSPIPQPLTIPTDPDQWACPQCTLHNPLEYLACEVCGLEQPPQPIPEHRRFASGHSAPSLPRPPPQSGLRGQGATPFEPAKGRLGWNCLECGTFMENQWWTCSLCGTMKLDS